MIILGFASKKIFKDHALYNVGKLPRVDRVEVAIINFSLLKGKLIQHP